MEISKEITDFQKIMKDAGLICKNTIDDYALTRWFYEDSCVSFWLCDFNALKKDEHCIRWKDDSYVALYDFKPIAKYEMYDRLFLEGTGFLKCGKREYDYNNIHRFKAALEKSIERIKKLEKEFKKKQIKLEGQDYEV